jgi:hypothetical protein
MALPYRYLDAIPIREARPGLVYRRQLSLANASAIAQGTISNRLDQIFTRLEGNNQYTLAELIKVLESHLYISLSTSFIQSLNGKRLSSHYSRYQKLISSEMDYPSEEYLDQLIYTDVLNWGTNYGTLGYELHLLESTETYQHPSQIAYLCVESQFRRFNIADSILNDLLKDDAVSDRNIYQYSVDSLREYSQVMTALRTISSFSQELFNWIEVNRRERVFPPAPSSPELQLGHEYLIQIARVFLKHGLSLELLSDLDYQLVHQTLPPILPELWEQLIFLRKAPLYIPEEGDHPIDRLVRTFLEGIPITLSGVDLQVQNYKLLGSMPQPGGYNQLLILLAVALINRAYILLYRQNQPSLTYRIFRPIEVNRALNLIYLAGYLLKKTNMMHWIILGSNLITLSERVDDTPPTIKDLQK